MILQIAQRKLQAAEAAQGHELQSLTDQVAELQDTNNKLEADLERARLTLRDTAQKLEVAGHSTSVGSEAYTIAFQGCRG